MMSTTNVVHQPSFRDPARRLGYSFREAAILTIAIGVGMHLYRVIFGNEVTLRYVVTPATDKILLIPMSYAAITGILLLVRHRVQFTNNRHRAVFTGSVGYTRRSEAPHTD